MTFNISQYIKGAIFALVLDGLGIRMNWRVNTSGQWMDGYDLVSDFIQSLKGIYNAK